MCYWKFIALPTLFCVVFAVAMRAQDVQAAQADVDSAVTNPLSNTTAASYVAPNTSNNLTDSSGNTTNESNNPVTPKRQIVLQNYFMPSPHGYNGRSADQELQGLYLPVKLFGIENIFRIYQPIETNPLFPDGRDGGFGDTTLYDLALHKVNNFTLGAGPLLVLPVASHKDLGDGKWQAGAAGIVVTERSWGLMAAVISYQHSFSGYGSDRRVAELLTVQPLVHYNLNKGFYLRSSGIWNLDYGNHVREIPIGFGAGKVWALPGGTVMNCFVEPQYSVYRIGTGAPIWQILSGVTFQLPSPAKGNLP